MVAAAAPFRDRTGHAKTSRFCAFSCDEPAQKHAFDPMMRTVLSDGLRCVERARGGDRGGRVRSRSASACGLSANVSSTCGVILGSARSTASGALYASRRARSRVALSSAIRSRHRHPRDLTEV
jgi:hypothetical protein